MTVCVEGSIDTITAPDLESELKARWEGITEVVLDFTQVNFLSSAGIRVIIWAHKQISPEGKLVIKNVNEDIREIFELTGLDSTLNFE